MMTCGPDSAIVVVGGLLHEYPRAAGISDSHDVMGHVFNANAISANDGDSLAGV